MKIAVKILLVASLCISTIFAALVYFQQSNRDCLNIPEIEAVGMINRIFADKQYRAPSNGSIFEHKLASLQYSHEVTREMDRNNSLGFVELQYNNKANKKALMAVIYSNCEIQWINGT